jgi:FixJ family two-component response regulator
MRPLVTIVDDDQSVRESLPDLLLESGFAVRAFASAEEFLTSDCLTSSECLILDMAMPGMSGIDLQHELTQSGHAIPIVFITASRDDAIRELVLSRGAVDCLFKPFSESVLLAAIDAALH